MNDAASGTPLRDQAQLCYLGFYSFYLSFSTGGVREITAPSQAPLCANARTWSSSVTIVTILLWLVLDVSDPW
jgi:hypothetical protein